ncbi:uncharacterized protein [Elaeis guineensis]|uniref:uncharacterized protein n=1 Tax=Elaeis guineensis var. tenera TaxID=51953 RepID=UPI003C6D906E
MTILFWNVRRLDRAQKRNIVRNTVKQSKCWIACLQETKLQNVDKKLVTSSCGSSFLEWHCKEAWGSAGGLLTCWDPNQISGVAIHFGEYSITTQFSMQGDYFLWHLTNVYGPHHRHTRSILMGELHHIKSAHPGPWVIVADFNVTRFSSERTGAASSRAASKEFNICINQLGLIEINAPSKKFIWTNFREEPSLVKLDRCSISLEWHNRCPLTSLSSLVRTTSDHTPLLLTFNSSCRQNANRFKPFRFENAWYLHQDLESLINQWWVSAPSSPEAISNLVLKLHFLQSKLKDLGAKKMLEIYSNKKREAEARIESIDILEEERNLSEEEINERTKLKSQLDVLIQQE